MSNYTITIVGNNIAELQERIGELLPVQPIAPTDTITGMDFQILMARVGERVEAEGYDMEVWKKGSRPEPELPPSEKKKEEARAKLRGDLVASLAEATHATSVVKEEVEAEVEAAAPKKAPKKAKAAANGKQESDEERKQRIIVQLQEMYTAGRKADVNKLLSEYGDGTRTFSAIPADKFVAIEAALETL